MIRKAISKKLGCFPHSSPTRLQGSSVRNSFWYRFDVVKMTYQGLKLHPTLTHSSLYCDKNMNTFMVQL